MLAFWRHGYETTSVADLTAAMGVNAPSLYAAFGDKRRLFLEAVALYTGDPRAISGAISDAPSALDAARSLLTSAAVTYTGDGTPKGCLLASATASGSADSAEVQRAVADVRRGIEDSLRARIERDVADGRLPGDPTAAALAGMVMAVSQGMSVLARDGATRATLLSIVEATLGAWPHTHPASRQRPKARVRSSRSRRL